MPESLPQIVVAGDVCLDVVALPISAPSLKTKASAQNWRLTGEKRTIYLRGGAMLLTQMVEHATGQAATVTGPILPPPPALESCFSGRVLPDRLFERLTREEVVHSLIEADHFRLKTGQKEKRPTAIRVRNAHGYSGPAKTDLPSLTPLLGDETATPELLILDDTGNRFRSDRNQWPNALRTSDRKRPTILLKLHRPLPASDADENGLWSHVTTQHADRLVVIVNLDDLRRAGARISAGLSWEKTALEFAAALQGNENLQRLRGCRWLVARCGLECALCWHCPDGDKSHAGLWMVYEPKGIEGQYAAGFPGGMTGYGSAFTAGMAAKLVTARLPVNPGDLPAPLLNGMIAGLLAARALLESGFAKPEEGELAYPLEAIGEAVRTSTAEFFCVPVPLPGSPANPDGERWTILKQLLPGGVALSKAAEDLTCKSDPPSALASAPMACYGDLLTYDRDEIEAYRGLANLIREYLANPNPERPLCISVFGPPGAGKSFGVREVMKSLAQQGTAISERTFNLAQFQSADDLGRALHLVRDDVISGKVPLVFLDEFDASLGGHELYWLKHLLAPMQDGKFFDAGADHPIGKSIFVFAGGTSSRFEEFSRKTGVDESKRAQIETNYRAAKGPNFVSRLRGILDIPGIELGDGYRGGALLRRARMLRFQLAKKATQLLDSGEYIRIDPGVLRAFLHVARFEHGVRSLESLIDMSQLAGHEDFNPGCLPAPAQLRLHVTPNQTDQPGWGFLDLVERESCFSRKERDEIAQAIHGHYLEERKKPGGGYMAEKASHREWVELSEFYKDSNRRQADDIPRKLRIMGLDWNRAMNVSDRKVLESFDASPEIQILVEAAARKEHDRWMAERRLAGWTYGEKEDGGRRQSPAMLDWDKLPIHEQAKDKTSILGIPRYLKAAGYVVLAPGTAKTN